MPGEVGTPAAGLAVVAFGGNAILRAGQLGTSEEQAENVAIMAGQLGTMVEAGWRVVITHGNGPQVGNLLLQQERTVNELPAMPLDICGAMTQGQIGYQLSNALSRELSERGLESSVVCLLTRCVVDLGDPAFASPTKPVGPFYSREEALTLQATKGWSIVADSGRGYRRVVPSPVPKRIVEWRTVHNLLQAGFMVIAAGGGGVPVIDNGDGSYEGVEAVIDKDLSASMLARQLAADALVMLTEVRHVSSHYGTPQQRELAEISVEEMRSLYEEGHFPAGSMGPKVQAALDFIEDGGKLALITSADNLMAGLAGQSGTRVCSSPSSS